ncbi:MAG TPA: hypothetical protein VK426_02490 [Methanobacterium sp.]|nr:hypothetical protein [Methanobacterium sp.]
MAKRQKTKKTSNKNKEIESATIMDDKEYRNLKYMFMCVFISSILFLGIYLVGFINILLN